VLIRPQQLWIITDSMVRACRMHACSSRSTLVRVGGRVTRSRQTSSSRASRLPVLPSPCRLYTRQHRRDHTQRSQHASRRTPQQAQTNQQTHLRIPSLPQQPWRRPPPSSGTTKLRTARPHRRRRGGGSPRRPARSRAPWRRPGTS
jgi:hypothetical protein